MRRLAKGKDRHDGRPRLDGQPVGQEVWVRGAIAQSAHEAAVLGGQLAAHDLPAAAVLSHALPNLSTWKKQ